MKNKIIRVIISVLLVLSCVVFSFSAFLKYIIYICSYLIIGYDVLKESFENILDGKIFDENFLMSIATIGALIIGSFDEAIAVMVLYQIGEMFQDYAVDKSKKSIIDLMNIKADYANIIVNDEIKKVSPDIIKTNDIIVINPGEKVPLDGVVVDGTSMIDTSSLTGESKPKRLSINDEILSGSINLDSVLKVKVLKEFKESTVSKILDLVENSSSKKSNSENFITKFAKIYTPVVVLIAFFIAIVPYFFFSENYIYKALSFLVISCPCALVISIPLSFFAGIGAASKKGVLIKGSNYLEKLSKSEILVCDKTGTLTEGIFKVQKINAINIKENELIKYAALAEANSNHPIALSIKNYFGKKIKLDKVEKVKEISGQGIKAFIDGKNILIGNDKLMKSNKIKYSDIDDIGTICHIAIDNKYSGYIIISDTIKKDSFDAIKNLKELGIKKVIMLTGDKKEIAIDVSNKLNIDECFYELLPNEKVEFVSKFMKEKNVDKTLIFVGDGINDAPVLAMSDIGISMGGIGSDAAIEASDVVLMNDKLSKISDAISISKKTMKIVKQNIIFSIGIKLLFLLLSIMGKTTMWFAVFADVGVSFIAILNALRILLIKYKK